MNIYIQNLKTLYLNTIILNFQKKYQIKNVMEIPKIKSIHLSMCLGDACNNKKIITKNQHYFNLIAGQKSLKTYIKKSISSFKIKKDMLIGLKVTLRKSNMWNFLFKLINIVLPRVKDFCGILSKFDTKGNITIGIRENIIFPEIKYGDIDKIRGMNITICTSTFNNNKAKFILMHLGLPLVPLK